MNACLMDLQLTKEEQTLESERIDDRPKRKAHFFVYCDAASCRNTVPQPGEYFKCQLLKNLELKNWGCKIILKNIFFKLFRKTSSSLFIVSRGFCGRPVRSLLLGRRAQARKNPGTLPERTLPWRWSIRKVIRFVWSGIRFESYYYFRIDWMRMYKSFENYNLLV